MLDFSNAAGTPPDRGRNEDDFRPMPERAELPDRRDAGFDPRFVRCEYRY
jgi:hypothetical protein